MVNIIFSSWELWNWYSPHQNAEDIGIALKLCPYSNSFYAQMSSRKIRGLNVLIAMVEVFYSHWKKLFGFMFINAQYSRSKRTFIYWARSTDLHEIKMPEGYTWSTVGAQRIWLKTFGSIKSIADKIPLSINAVGFSKHVLSGFNLPKENMLELWGFMCFWDMSSQIAKELWHN